MKYYITSKDEEKVKSERNIEMGKMRKTETKKM